MAVEMGSFPVLRDLPEDYYPAIGKVMVEWAFVESLLRDTLYTLLRLNRKQGRIAVKFPRAHEAVTMIEDLMSLQSLSTSVKTKELKKALIKLGGARDAVAHGVWVMHQNSKTPVLQVLSGSFAVEPGEPAVKARVHPIAMASTPQEIQITADQIRKLSGAVERLIGEISSQIGPLPEISPEQ